MDDQDQSKLARIQSVLMSLLEHQMGESLSALAGALDDWKAGEIGPLMAHRMVIEHVERAKTIVGRVAQIRPGGAAGLLREAFDASLIDRDEFVGLVGVAPEQVPRVQDDAPAPPDKRALVDELLAAGPILVHLDARAPDVSVPAGYRTDPRLVLRFGYDLSPPIHDLEIDDDGVRGTLTFAGQPHHCVIPWSAVYAVVSDGDRQGTVWPEDVPEAVLEQIQRAAETELTPVAPADASDRGDSPEPPDDGPPSPSDPGGGKRRPSYLKVVK